MKMKPYLYMIKVRVLIALTYRFEVFVNILTGTLFMFVSTFFWRTAFSGIDYVAQVNENQMLRYSVMAIMLGKLFQDLTFSVENEVRDKVQQGNISVDYIKPVKIFVMYFFEDLGISLMALILKGVPVLIFAALFVVAPLPASLSHLILFLISTAMSYTIMWFLSALFALLYFKAFNLGPLGNIRGYTIMILSGSFIPVWFFPDILQRILSFLPFVYIYQLPLGIFVGRESLQSAAIGIMIQLAWCVLFGFLFEICRKRVERSILVQGG